MLRRLRYWLGGGVRARARRARRQQLLAARDCRRTQERVLKELLALHARSDFSRDYGLARVRSVRDFQRALPIADFERARPYVDRVAAGEYSALLGPGQAPLMFALSSGTTAEPKRIPVTPRFLADYRRGWTVWGIGVYDDHPPMNLLHMVQLASSHDRGRTPAGIPCGNISGLVQQMQNRIVQSLYSVPPEVLQISEPEAKAYAALRFALADPHVGMLTTANPSTLVHLAELAERRAEELLRDIHDGTLGGQEGVSASLQSRLRARLRPSPDRARRLHVAAGAMGRLSLHVCWPNLQLLAIWTGGGAGAYLPHIRELFPGVPIRDHGLSASEGRMTIPLEDGAPSGLLDVSSHFFEFVPEDQIDAAHPDVLLADELSPGGRYFILLTTSSGLYRYDIRDVVRCTGFFGEAPLLEFLHKGARIANLTGEKLTESQVVEAALKAARPLSLTLGYFTLTPSWGQPPAYALLHESSQWPPEGAAGLARALDAALRDANCEYDDKRRSGRLGPVFASALPEGAWDRQLRARQARPGGSLEQYKHAFLAPDLQHREMLLRDFGGISEAPAPGFLRKSA